MEATVFSSLFAWAQGAITTGIAGNFAYDGLKKLAQSFKNRFNKFFSSEDDVERFFEALCKVRAKNPDKPYRDAEDLYEEATHSTLKDDVRTQLFDEVKSWMQDNRELIVNISTHQHDNEFSINIGSQKAKNIVNIQGTANINEFK